MQKITCELCGGNELVKEGGFLVCSHCGTKYSLEEARKMLGTVVIDKSKDVENWLVIARREGREGNATNAAKYFGLVLEQDPDNWEAYFYQRFHQVNKCKVSQISDSIDLLKQAIATTAGLIDKSPMTDNEKWVAFARVCSSAMKYAEAIGQTEERHRENKARMAGVSSSTLSMFGLKQQSGKPEWIVSAEGIYTKIEELLGSKRYSWMDGEEYSRFLSETWSRNCSFVEQYGYFYSRKEKQALAGRAEKYMRR